MNNMSGHTFHIPVMGIGFTIDTPIKVARFGISSVVSIVQDQLVEQMREFYSRKVGEVYISIPKDDLDHRAKRITSYLNLLQRIVQEQLQRMLREPFEEGNDIVTYFTLLPADSPLKKIYLEMMQMSGDAREFLQNQLRKRVVAGDIDVNIMTKLDNLNFTKDNEPLPVEYADAMSALRGFAMSDLASSVIFSAGMNPRLFAYLEQFPDFFPNKNGDIKKKIVLKVSDYRSALIQGKFLAKKGIWVSEFRIESGLNCGGHAFPTEGRLLGPILEEFKANKQALISELLTLCNAALNAKNYPMLKSDPELRVTVQGGIGTAAEDKFLREYYGLDGTGWGSPFLLVPEATNVDDETLHQLVDAQKEDYYLSHSSPLGVPFNNFRKSSSETQRKLRIEKNRAGSPCYLNHLAFNTEFDGKPVCLGSRKYQHQKLKELSALNLPEEQFKIESDKITEKDCLCEGLSSSVLIRNQIPDPHNLKAVAICPGPNLAYFSSVFSLDEMIGHIYGRVSILNLLNRKHMFLNELKMYVDYLKEEIQKNVHSLSGRQLKYFSSFKTNLLSGIGYYKELIPKIGYGSGEVEKQMNGELEAMENTLRDFISGQLDAIIGDGGKVIPQ